MASLRAPRSATQAGVPEGAKVDSGAQYISKRMAEDAAAATCRPFYDILSARETLRPMSGVVAGNSPYAAKPGELQDLIAPGGLSEIPKNLLDEAAVDAHHFDTALRRIDAEEGKGLELNGEAVDFDFVVLTMPVPQMLGAGKFGLTGNFLSHVEDEVRARLEAVQFSMRFALALFWPPGTDLGASCQGWVAQYFDKGAVRYASQDAAKRGKDKEGPTMLVHSSVPFALKRPEAEADPWEAAQEELLRDLNEKLPGLPPPAGVRTHRWKYSQVYVGYGGKRNDPQARPMQEAAHGAGYVDLLSVTDAGGRKRSIIAAGDAFAVTSNFEGALQSAVACAERLGSHVSDRRDAAL